MQSRATFDDRSSDEDTESLLESEPQAWPDDECLRLPNRSFNEQSMMFKSNPNAKKHTELIARDLFVQSFD